VSDFAAHGEPFAGLICCRETETAFVGDLFRMINLRARWPRADAAVEVAHRVVLEFQSANSGAAIPTDALRAPKQMVDEWLERECSAAHEESALRGTLAAMCS
jgi:hypothetical protein